MQMLSVASYEAIVKYLLDKSKSRASVSPSLNHEEEHGKSSSQRRKCCSCRRAAQTHSTNQQYRGRTGQRTRVTDSIPQQNCSSQSPDEWPNYSLPAVIGMTNIVTTDRLGLPAHPARQHAQVRRLMVVHLKLTQDLNKARGQKDGSLRIYEPTKPYLDQSHPKST
jgi:hypothetical protein